MHHSASSRRRVCVIVLSGIIYLCSSVCTLMAQSQQDSSAISGTVVDSHGSAIPHAAIVAKNQSTGVRSDANSDNAGQFKIAGIPEGRYTVVVTASGFAPTTQKDVPASSAPAAITVTLNIGNVAQNVEVRAIAGDSIAGQDALSQDTLDTEVPKSEIGSEFIQEFTPPTTD
jgi:hypothetical protein